jgi:glutaredoxin
MFILRLYVLEGCPSCQQAIQFIQSKRLPFEVFIANNDPIIKAGNMSLNNGEDKYPVLLYNTTKEMVVGYDGGKYERICEAAAVLFNGGAWNVSSGGQQSNGEAPTPPAEAAAGTD